MMLKQGKQLLAAFMKDDATASLASPWCVSFSSLLSIVMVTCAKAHILR